MNELHIPEDVIVVSSWEPINQMYFSGNCFIGKDIILGQNGLNTYLEKNAFHPENLNEGGFTLIYKQNNKIFAKNDCMGQDVIYYYYADKQWALSNSFYALLKLLSSKGLILNFNKAASLFRKINHSTGEQLLTNNTLVKEIKVLPSDCEISIAQNVLSITKKIENQYENLSYDQLISQYIQIWSQRANTLTSYDSAKVSVDISGGVDSRAVFSSFILSVKDMNKIKFNSNPNWIEDFKIAESLGNMFNFKLNASSSSDNIKVLNGAECYNAWKYGSFGVYTKIYYPFHKSQSDYFQYHGAGGETLRHHMSGSATNYIRNIKKYFENEEHHKLVENELLAYFRENNINPDAVSSMPFHYKNLRQRFHFGRRWVKNMTANIITPLLSPLLVRAFSLLSNEDKVNNKLVFDLISRSSPLLASLPFDKADKCFPSEFWKTFDYSKQFKNAKDLECGQVYYSSPAMETSKPNSISFEQSMLLDLSENFSAIRNSELFTQEELLNLEKYINSGDKKDADLKLIVSAIYIGETLNLINPELK